MRAEREEVVFAVGFEELGEGCLFCIRGGVLKMSMSFVIALTCVGKLKTLLWRVRRRFTVPCTEQTPGQS